jgi:hypothetical protein
LVIPGFVWKIIHYRGAARRSPNQNSEYLPQRRQDAKEKETQSSQLRAFAAWREKLRIREPYLAYGYVYAASHRAGSTPGALPMGARLRLKASVDVNQRTSDPNVRKIFRAMQKYGLIVADNGSDMTSQEPMTHAGITEFSIQPSLP